MATFLPSEGAGQPEVTNPNSEAPASSRMAAPWRAGGPLADTSPTRLRFAPSAICCRIICAPGKSPSWRRRFATSQVSPASTGVVVVSMSLP